MGLASLVKRSGPFHGFTAAFKSIDYACWADN
jgi:hypothetical protein